MSPSISRPLLIPGLHQFFIASGCTVSLPPGLPGYPREHSILAPSFPGVFFVVVWCFLGKGQAQARLMCSVTKDDEGCLMSNQVQGPSDKRSKALKCKPKPNLKRERDKMGNNPPENIHHSAEGDDVWV